ncbi:MAG: hypothetical protein KKC79_11590 [Gammaproteobacteria bacterium]|nr:hypothetical protein [Gammaproteobacteria bacterium]MBU2409272.1 hypothetical protein [Gammaproteobacteria bacterium]
MKLLDNLKAISALSGPADAAQDTLNSMIALKRSLEMTALELLNMQVDTSYIKAKIEEVKKSVSDAAVQYANLRTQAEVDSQSLRAQGQGITSALESPVDFKKSKLKAQFIGSDSLKFDSHYFSFTDKSETANTVSKIKEFLTTGTSPGNGDRTPSPLVSAGLDKVNNQLASNKLEGTLIITAACTHAAARMLQPVVLDPERTLRAWNRTFSNDAIDISNPQALTMAAYAPADPDADALNIVTGATCGSSFVGMAHIISNSEAANSSDQGSFYKQLDAIEQHAALSAAAGHIGFDQRLNMGLENTANSSIQVHLTILTAGVIPTVGAHDMKEMALKFADISPDQMEAAMSLAGPDSHMVSKRYSADKSKQANGVASLHAYMLKTTLTALGEKDEEKNETFTLESLINAFDSYVEAITPESRSSDWIPPGVPMNFFLRPVTKADVARLWIEKLSSDRAGKDKDDKEDENDDWNSRSNYRR